MIVPMSKFFLPGAMIVQRLGGLIVYPVCLGLALLYGVIQDSSAN